MTAKGDRGFPCFLWLSEPFSEQGQDEERSSPDYVFFPATEFQQRHDRYMNQESERGTLPKAQECASADA